MSRHIHLWGPSSIDMFRENVAGLPVDIPNWDGAINTHPSYWLSAESMHLIEKKAETQTDFAYGNLVEMTGTAMFSEPIAPLDADGTEIWGVVWARALTSHGWAVLHIPLTREVNGTDDMVLVIIGDDPLDGTGVTAVNRATDSDRARHLLRHVAAMHELMVDEARAEVAPMRSRHKNRKTSKRNRAKPKAPATYMVNLRGTELAGKSVESREPSEPTGRHIEVRYEVREHTRNQAYGPRRSLRRLITVPAHVRGPEDAPFSHKNYRVTAA